MKNNILVAVIFLAFMVSSAAGIVAIYQGKETAAQLKMAQVQVESMRQIVGPQAEYISTLNALIGKLKEYQQFDQYTPEQVTGLATMVLEQSALYSDAGVTSALIMAVMEKESGFNPLAVSSVRAVGLMQVRRAAAQNTLERMGYVYSIELMQDPILSTKVGTEYLVWLHRIFMSEGVEKSNEWSYTLMAYNNGPSVAFAFIAGDDIVVNGEYAAAVAQLRGHYEGIGME